MIAERPRVVVVGAGLAGLTAADELTARGATVTVLEARDRVGGRTLRVPMTNGAFADGGAAYLGDRHSQLLRLVKDHDLALATTEMIGDSTFLLSGGHLTTARRVPPLDPIALGGLFDSLEAIAARVDADAPWETLDAERLDRLTAAEWLVDENLHPDAQAFFPLFLGEMMATDPESISALHMAFYLRSGGGLRYLNAFRGGAQEWRIAGGSQQVCEALAQKLGDAVLLSHTVTAVHQDRGEVVVQCVSDADGTASRFRADRVVVAVPPQLAQRIDFEPELPCPRATPATGRGCAVKVQFGFTSPLWRTHGVSGWSVSSEPPLLLTVDDSPPDESAGVLTGFVVGQAAHEFSAMTDSAQRQSALTHLRRLFPDLPAPDCVVVTDWLAEDYSHGCYAALFGPGDWLQLGPRLSTPHGLVYWAGAETTLEYFGLMEGAVRSGQRAATELLLDHSGQRRPSQIRYE